jgi:hypothetical protein
MCQISVRHHPVVISLASLEVSQRRKYANLL